jgi:hypothetical protein
VKNTFVSMEEGEVTKPQGAFVPEVQEKYLLPGEPGVSPGLF